MTRAARATLRLLVIAVGLGVLLSTGNAAEKVHRCTLVLDPPNSGIIYWFTQSPQGEGAVYTRKRVPVCDGATLSLTIVPHSGFTLAGVTVDSQPALPGVGGSLFLGPVRQAHRVVATYTPVAPTGDFDLSTFGAFSIPRIMDVTGNYSGVSPTKHERNYAFDVAMDETGKLDVMGSVDGIEPAGGGPIEGGVGRIKTVNGEPMLTSRGRFVGTRDGVATSGSASLRGPAELQQDGPDPNVAMGSLSYNARVGGVPFRDRNMPIQTPVDPSMASNLRSDWSIALRFQEPATKRANRVVMASATLTLPNGDTVEFAPKRTRYSPRSGYRIFFRRGTNTTLQPPAVDRRTKVRLIRMSLVENGFGGWAIDSGKIRYRFLGQRGVANLIDFAQR